VIFALPLYDDNPTKRPPVATWFLIGLCIGAFCWELGQNQRHVFLSFGMIPAVLFGSAELAPALRVVPPWASLLTSMFLHGGWFHLIGNMVFLWIFGNNVEDALGRGRYLLLYLGSGVAAGVCQALSDPADAAPMVGASGAIAGVLGAYLLLYPWSQVHVFLWIVIFFRIFTVPAWILLGLWFAMQLLSGLARPAGSPGVAFWAHVGGFVSGLVLVVLLRPRQLRLLHPARSRGFAAIRPRAFTGRRTFHRGSVPDTARPFVEPRGPWG
jgi:membrane associated rhomboid family serine protease